MKKDIKALLNEVEKKLVKRVHERPSQDALDRLALFAGFQNWRTFQRELHEGNVKTEEEQSEE